jgi:hypothetical protein
VNAGGDPDRDDFGLPPIDIEIPDDARELDRDVQAYQRELRAMRRRQRARRLRGPLTREGMILPLLAGCLILALITSTLLIMFAADQTGMPDQPSHVTTQPAARGHSAPSTPAAGKINGPLPAGSIIVAGQAVPLRAIAGPKPAVLALVPLDCGCSSTLQQLTAQAAQAQVPVYLVAANGGEGPLTGLASKAGSPDSVKVAEDTSGVLFRAYGRSGATAILVRPDGSVASVASLPQKDLETSLRQLSPAKPASP